MVFIELLRMAEEKMGEMVVDSVLDDLDLVSGGAYTSIGNYPCSDLMKLVGAFSEKSSIPSAELQRLFGHWMLDRFAVLYPTFFAEKTRAFDMLEAIENEIHVEVRKLYPDAELPRFHTERIDAGELRLTYSSSRPLVHFCHGLIEACLAHFGETGEIALENRSPAGEAEAIFTVTLTSAP
jgi:hypothetical protein